MESQSQVIDRLRETFRSGITKPEEFRREQLNNLISMIRDNEEQFLNALHKDLAKPKFEAIMSEMDIVFNEAYHALTHLKSWMQPEYVGKNLATKLDDCFVKREPLGVVLIIGAWNYPVNLILNPMVGAIAAGNCVIVKPSEISSATEAVIAELFPKYLSPECYAVIRGGVEETKALLKNRFDHIFYTGSQMVARSIMQAASVHLTPVTLELGGKCPTFIYGKVDYKAAAQRLVWAKFFNSGQSCVAPDYLLCSKATQDALVPAIAEALKNFYGEDPRISPDVTRMVTTKHWTRVMEQLKSSGGTIVVGGESNQEEKYIAPTVVVGITKDDSLMDQEIFGPILPILTFESLQEGIDFVNTKEKPLALYVYSDESSVVKKVMDETSSGGFCSNDGIIHMAIPTLPFGGVGVSGSGSYHGRWGFETFSHRRACMMRGWALERLNSLRYPPYDDNKLGWLRWTTSPKSSCNIL